MTQQGACTGSVGLLVSFSMRRSNLLQAGNTATVMAVFLCPKNAHRFMPGGQVIQHPAGEYLGLSCTAANHPAPYQGLALSNVQEANMAVTPDTNSNVIPFPAPPRIRDKDRLIQEIAALLNRAESTAQPSVDGRLLARLEQVADRLERIVQRASA